MNLYNITEMKIAIVGSRDYHKYDIIKTTMDQIRENMKKQGLEIIEIVSGGASGVDTLARQYAEENKLQFKEFPADWAQYGKSAGPMRNQQIVNYSDYVVAFPSGPSHGTRDTIKRAIKVGKLALIVELA